MNAPRNILSAIVVLLVLAPGAFAQQPPKMYRWVGADGKTHYSDDLPPEALTQARQEMSKSNGITLKQVDRALTPEELVASRAKAEADAKAAEALAKAKQSDDVLLSSYPTEADLLRAYDDRIGQVAENLKSTRIGLDSQQQSLSEQLVAASNLELVGKPVPLTLRATIQTTHGHIVEQQQSESAEEARTAGLRQESAATLARYRDLRKASSAGRGGDAPSTPATNPPAAASAAGG